MRPSRTYASACACTARNCIINTACPLVAPQPSPTSHLSQPVSSQHSARLSARRDKFSNSIRHNYSRRRNTPHQPSSPAHRPPSTLACSRFGSLGFRLATNTTTVHRPVHRGSEAAKRPDRQPTSLVVCWLKSMVPEEIGVVVTWQGVTRRRWRRVEEARYERTAGSNL
ncbi:uncharacterized protein BKA78DRAFT_312532 [Phyllosticta capitalensis]|uniref:uncharacterized protein n=1 Tax=Phyllosticta capitalensis TaxID=121624 RepID=UPI00312EABCE